MSSSPSNPPSRMKILVSEDELIPITADESGELQEQAGFLNLFRRGAKEQEIDLTKAKGEIRRVEDEIDELLGTLAADRKGGFRLSEVQVAVGVSVQGSFAVVTAGLQASLTLVYSRPDQGAPKQS